MDPLIGRTIGRYVITGGLGEGGMAVVYKARQPSLNRDVAVKVLTGPLARDPEFVSRFRREAIAAGSLGHPNILTIYDAGTTGDGLIAFDDLLLAEP
jgi:serine/threonine protein kinase